MVEADFDAAAEGPSNRPEFAVVFTGADDVAQGLEAFR
jgi:hypothetical protein